MTIGSRLKARRKELGLEVAEVARAVGMAPSTLYDIERGDQASSTKLHLLCAFLGLNPRWVETGRGERLAADTSRIAANRKVNDTAAEYTLHGMQITPEEVEVGIEWGKLDEPLRGAIKQQIYLLVAEQVRRRRRKDPPEERPAQPRKPS